jgi:hypothetical protein
MVALADGAAGLLAAAVRAAILAKAPRRTVQAVAAAVTGVLVRPAADDAAPLTSVPMVAAGAVAGSSPDELAAALRAARAEQRRKKRARRRERKSLAAPDVGMNDSPEEGAIPAVVLERADKPDENVQHMQEDSISDIDMENELLRMSLASKYAELDLRLAAAAAGASASSASAAAPSKGKGDQNNNADKGGRNAPCREPEGYGCRMCGFNVTLRQAKGCCRGS